MRGYHTSFRKDPIAERVRKMNAECQRILHNPNNPLRLTPGEVECLVAMLSGKVVKEMADELGKSNHTIRTFTERVYRKFGVRTSIDLARACLSLGYISEESFVKPYKKEQALSGDGYTLWLSASPHPHSHPRKINGEGYRIWRKK